MHTWIRPFLFLATALTLAAQPAPEISHDPITAAPPGKSLSVLARVSAPNSTVKAVHLHYTPSADASPRCGSTRSTGI